MPFPRDNTPAGWQRVSRGIEGYEKPVISIAAQMFFFAGAVPTPDDSSIFNSGVICCDLRNTPLLLQVHFLVELTPFGG